MTAIMATTPRVISRYFAVSAPGPGDITTVFTPDATLIHGDYAYVGHPAIGQWKHEFWQNRGYTMEVPFTAVQYHSDSYRVDTLASEPVSGARVYLPHHFVLSSDCRLIRELVIAH